MNVVPNRRLGIVILAAGQSRRLGRSKALARMRGISLLRRTATLAAGLAAAGRESVLVVLPARAPRLVLELRGLGVAMVVNRQRARGLSTSVQAGIARARHSAAALLLPVDLAGLERRELARLIARWRAAPRRVAARGVDGHAATPLILPRRLYGAARQLRGEAGLREWVGRLPPWAVRLRPLPSAAFDVDTPQDLATARRCRRPRAARP